MTAANASFAPDDAARRLPVAPPMPIALAAGYRADIDGLRALAVLAVVLFHANVPLLPGGFTGVDIFFVISGYLIGGHILREAVGGHFSFADFYARRVRRILPALCALIAAMYAIGLAMMTPAELRQLGMEAVAAIVGLSNAYYYNGNGYFSPAAERHPLLMTWSLGVEEQFYLLFPIVMLLALRFRRDAAFPIVLVLSVVSFVVSMVLLPIDPSGAFYLLPARAWELGAGVLLAVWEARRTRAVRPGRSSETTAALGVALLAASLLLYRPAYAFPGLFAAIPVVGTTLLIATPHAAVNRLVLARPLATFVGRISYSLYLWHWPVFYFNRVWGEPGGGAPVALLIALCVLLGYLSWRFVEQPLRRRVLGHRALFVRYAAIVALLAGAGFLLYRGNGLPQRLAPVAEASARDAASAKADRCLAPYGVSAPTALAECAPPLPAGVPGVLLLGDSHASALAPGVADAARAAGLGFAEMTKASCLPLHGLARAMPGRLLHVDQCIAYQDATFAWLAAHPEIRTVVLAGYWSNGDTTTASDGTLVPLAVALERSARRIEAMGRNVVIALDAPSFDFDPYAAVLGEAMPLRRAMRTLLGTRRDPDTMVGHDHVLPDPTREAVIAVARSRPGRDLIDPMYALCREQRCRYARDGVLYYFDYQHLTAAGARAIAARSALDGLLARHARRAAR